MKKKTRALKKPLRSQQVPATTAMLYEMEERLTYRMDAGFGSLRTEFKTDFESVRTEFKADFNGLRSEFGNLRSEFGSLKSDVSQIKSELHRVALLVEEQNARNKYVMDGYAQLYELLVHRSST